MLWRIRRLTTLPIKPSSTSTTYIVQVYDAEGIGTDATNVTVSDEGDVPAALLEGVCTALNATRTPNDWGCV